MIEISAIIKVENGKKLPYEIKLSYQDVLRPVTPSQSSAIVKANFYVSGKAGNEASIEMTKFVVGMDKQKEFHPDHVNPYIQALEDALRELPYIGDVVIVLSDVKEAKEILKDRIREKEEQ